MTAAITGGLHGAHAPVTYERAVHVDGLGHTNEIFLAYWLDAETEKAWAADHPLDSWAAPELTAEGGPIGLWSETLWAPVDHFETSYSYDSPSWGLASRFPAEPNVYHSYHGAMRDRIAAAEDGGLAGEAEYPPRTGPVESAGRHLVVTTPGTSASSAARRAGNSARTRNVPGSNSASCPSTGRASTISPVIPERAGACLLASST